MVHGQSLAHDRRGAAIVEFALLLPLLAALLFGILSYGQYFLLAHSVQGLANDAARATVAGLTTAERARLVADTVSAELPGINAMPADRVTSRIEEQAGLAIVTVRLDATGTALFRTPLVPLPPALIERRAVIRIGGGA